MTPRPTSNRGPSQVSSGLFVTSVRPDILISTDDWKPVPDDTYRSASLATEPYSPSYVYVGLLSKYSFSGLNPLPPRTEQKNNGRTLKFTSGTAAHSFMGGTDRLPKGKGKVLYLQRNGVDFEVVASHTEGKCTEIGAEWPKTTRTRCTLADIWTGIKCSPQKG